MKRSLSIVVGVTLVVSLFAPTNSEVSAASVNGACKKVGTMAGTTKKPLVCKKVGKKLIWKAVAVKAVPKSTPTTTVAPVVTTIAPVVTTIAPVTTSAPALLNETVSQRNARKSGASYLKYSAFSRSGLILQLEYEKFTNADAIYAVDAQNADWNAQAAKSAESYLKYSSFSREGLIEQLLYEGFT